MPKNEPWPEAVRHLPVCPRRKLPIPYIAEVGADGVGHFTVLDDAKAAECLAGRLCAMCSRPMGGEVALIGDVVSLDPGGYFIEPPVHESCGEVAFGGLCPFLARELVPRRPPEDTMTIVGGGRHELTDIGRTIAKRPMIMAVVEAYAPAWAVNDGSGLTLVYQAASRPVRVRRFTWQGGRATEVVPEPPKPVTVVRSQPRRARSRAGRRRPA
jgi:hypothetical protein